MYEYVYVLLCIFLENKAKYIQEVLICLMKSAAAISSSVCGGV